MEDNEKLDDVFDAISAMIGEIPTRERDPNVEFLSDDISPEGLDRLLADGWRHFGITFFRYDIARFNGGLCNVIPLRIRLKDFSLSKSQRRTLNKNRDLSTVIRPIEVTDEAETLFQRHKERFTENVPRSIFDYLWIIDPESVPCPANELCVYQDSRLVAASYFDLGKDSISSIYGMFEPTMAGRRLGIFTMLKEIEYAIETGRKFYYLGYAYEGESFYDYKKRFRATEAFDWRSDWNDFLG